VTLEAGGAIAATASCPGGRRHQQDAHRHVVGGAARAVIVADGVSGATRSELASNAAVAAVERELARKTGARLTPRDLMAGLFEAARRAVIEVAHAHAFGPDGPATTLIVALELADRVCIGYVGDGAAVVTSGRLQWMTNVLHPQAGRGAALGNALGPDTKSARAVTAELPKVWDDGAVVLIGTDGGLAPGEVLSTGGAVLDEIRSRIPSVARPDWFDRTVDVLARWVHEGIDTDDNRTLGLLVSREALRFWTTELNSTHAAP
jgi:hypothetical protein